MKTGKTLLLFLICIPPFTLAYDKLKVAGEIVNLKLGVKRVVSLQEHTAAGPKSEGKYTNKYGAVCVLDEKYFVFGAFATLDGFDLTGTKADNAQQQFLCLGFGQRTKKFDIAYSAMQAYLAHPDAFGIVVSLPGLFSGNENKAKQFFSQVCVLEKINTQIQCRRNEKNQSGEVGILVDQAWVIPVGQPSVLDNTPNDVTYVGILKISVGNEDTFRFCKSQNFSKIDTFEIEDLNFEIGTQQVDETKALLTFFDYVQKTQLTDMTTMPTKPIDLNNHLYALTYTIDFVFRKLSGVDRGDPDKTPAGNSALVTARFLLGMTLRTQIEFSTLIAVLLKDVTRYSDTTITEIKAHFGDEVATLANPSRKSPPKITIYDLLEGEEAFFKTFEDTDTKTGLQENEALVKLLERRYKAYFKEKTLSEKRITVKVVKGFKIETTIFAVFSAIREDHDINYHFVMRGQVHSNPKVLVWQIVVEELLKSDLDAIKKCIREDYLEARLFYLQMWKQEYNNVVTEADCKVLEAMDMAAGKHAGEVQKRKGGFKSAYLNHVLGVLKAFVCEGNMPLIYVKLFWNEANTQEVKKQASKIVQALKVALLHDTLENTSATKEELTIVFGREVADWVNEVTDPKELKTSEAKKANQEEKALTQSSIASLVKMSDRINNLRDWLLLLPDALAWPKIPFYVQSTKNLVKNYKLNFGKNKVKWHPWETDVFNNLVGILDNLLVYYKTSCTPFYSFHL